MTKNCTDLEQSKKLAGFLPFESADMKILSFGIDIKRRVVPIDDIAVLNEENTELPDVTMESAVDATYEMIIKLHELNLL